MKKIIVSSSILFALLAAVSIYYYNIIYKSQTTQTTSIFIGSSDTVKDVLKKLTPYCTNIKDVKKVMSLKKYNHVKAGKYIIQKGINANQLVNLLRSGKQTPVKVTFNNQAYIENLAGRISHQIEADSLSILKSLTNPDFLKKHQLTPKTALHICMPYTYECYWNIAPNELRSKFLKTYQRFWNTSRISKAQKLNLSQNKIISLAAIVHKETANKPERKKVAGVYLNRVKRGIPLQADPTIIYAIKEKYGRDKIIKRVLNKDLKIKSTYNTYLNRGIPPSAITMPDVDAIEAVLNAEKHNYIYFCANPEKFGTHNFAKTLRQHNRNAIVYQRWLNKQKIRR